MNKPPPTKDHTSADRQRRRRARGRSVSAVLTDPGLIARWDDLVAEHGTQRAALEALLRERNK